MSASAKLSKENLSALRVAIASAAIILMAVVVVFYFRGRQARLAWRTIEILRELSDLHRDIRTEESAQRGYLLTGDEHYLSETALSLEDADAQITQLSEHIEGSPLQAQRVRLLRTIVGAKLKELNTTVGLYRNGKQSEAYAIVNSDAGERYMVQIDSLLNVVRVEEERRLNERTGVRDTTLIWVYVLLGLAIAVLCYSLFKIYRQLSGVIETLGVERERYREIAVERQREIDRRERTEYYNELLIAHLEERNQALDRYAYTTSHDLLQPLRTINGMIDALSEDFPELLEGEPGTYLEMVSSSATRMQTMVSGLLERSRDQTGEESIPLDLNGVVDEIERDLQQLIAEYGATIGTTVMPFVQAQPTKVRTILQNLVSNAVKYGAPGRAPHVLIGAEPVSADDADRTHGAASDSGSASAGRWRVYVKDNGRGIAPDKIDQISNYGERGDSEDKDGHGIGLASVTEAIRSIDGQLRIESTVGEGSTFSFEVRGVDSVRPGGE